MMFVWVAPGRERHLSPYLEPAAGSRKPPAAAAGRASRRAAGRPVRTGGGRSSRTPVSAVLHAPLEQVFAPLGGVEFLLDHRHLWLRSRRQNAILRVRAETVAAINPNVISPDVRSRWGGEGYSSQVVIENNGEFPVDCILTKPIVSGGLEFRPTVLPAFEADPGSYASWVLFFDGERLPHGERARAKVKVECGTNPVLAGPVIEIARTYIGDAAAIEALRVTKYALSFDVFASDPASDDDGANNLCLRLADSSAAPCD